MKKIALILILLFITSTAGADKLRVPFDCYPKEIQKMFLARGIQLDLDGNDRTRDSWGFIQNEGASYIIYTYKAINDEELTIVREIVLESLCSQEN